MSYVDLSCVLFQFIRFTCYMDSIFESKFNFLLKDNNVLSYGIKSNQSPSFNLRTEAQSEKTQSCKKQNSFPTSSVIWSSRLLPGDNYVSETAISETESCANTSSYSDTNDYRKYLSETAVRKTESSVSTSSYTNTNAYWRYLLETAVSETDSTVNTSSTPSRMLTGDICLKMPSAEPKRSVNTSSYIDTNACWRY